MLKLSALRYISLFLFVAIISSCIKPPDYPDEPVIEFFSLNSNLLIEQQDDLIITFSFTDGDGDLGSEDSLNVFLEDMRVPGFIRPFKIPFIPPRGHHKAISGEIQLTLPSNTVSCVLNPEMDTLVYSITIEDRAGNVSNAILTPDILIECQ